MDINKQIDEFTEFAKARLGRGSEHSIDEIYSEWRRESLQDVDALAVQASVNDLQQGERGRTASEFLAEFDEEQAG